MRNKSVEWNYLSIPRLSQHSYISYTEPFYMIWDNTKKMDPDKSSALYYPGNIKKDKWIVC